MTQRKKRKPSIGKIKVKTTLPRTALIDHLTGLYNRRYLDKSLKTVIAESMKKKDKFSLLMIDLDNFKAINDKYGHLAGDKILNNLAKVLRQSVRRVDICFRYGGDEIAIILPNAGKEAAESIVTRLKTKIERYKFPVDGKKLFLKLSIGLAIFPDDGTTPDILIKKADTFLYQAKSQKKLKKAKITEPFILKTKITLPSVKETVISRTRLNKLLKENFNKKLILMIADAGYGKTTFLSQIIKEQNLPVVFYDVDKSDGDLMVFLSYLTEGLEQIQPNLAQRTSGLLEQGVDVTKNYELVTGTLINELIEKRKKALFIILDDYHTLTDNSLVHKALDYFIDKLPETIHVIISSRSTPTLSSLAKWRFKQNLFELSRNDLRFTENEAKELLKNVYNVMLSDEELKRVFEQTEGWITGLQLILQSAGRDRKTIKETLNGYLEANQPLFEYFANEVLLGESSKVQEFLKYSSILETITPDACDNILEIKNSAQLLKNLEKRHLFLTTVGKEEYKYHHLFREFLLNHFKDKRLKISLNLKAANYYKKKEQTEQAIQHYLEASSFEKAGTLIVKIATHMIDQARFTTLNKWFKRIPEGITVKQPQILLANGMMYRSKGQLQKAEDLYIQAERLFRKEGNMSALAETLLQKSILSWISEYHKKALKILSKALKVCPTSEVKLRVNILNLLGLVWTNIGDLKRAQSYLLRAYRVAKHANESREIIIIGQNLAYPLYQQGEVRAVFKSLAPLIEQIKETYKLKIGNFFTNAARVGLDFGKVQWAEQCLDMGWELCQPYEDPWSKAALYGGFGSLYTQKAKWNIAEQYLHKARNEYIKLKWVRAEFVVLRDFCRLYRYRGDFTEAEKYLKLMRQKIDDIETIMGSTFFVETSLLQTCLRKFKKAEENIDVNLRIARKYGWKINIFLSYLTTAAVHLGNGKGRAAKKFLRSALRLAKTKGYDGILIRELRNMPELVDLAQRYSIENNYLISLNLPTEKPKLQMQIKCFNKLELQDAHGKILPIDWPTEKTRSLFAFLISYHGSPLHRDIILEELWPGLTKNRASENFRTTASRLRQSLFKVLSGKILQDRIFVKQRGTYQILPDVQIQTDMDKFNFLLKEAERTDSDEEKAKILREALELYKGDFLPEVYDSWTDVFRGRLREHRLNALRWLAEYTLRKGDDFGCISACETYLSVDPLSEDIVRLCMKSLSRLGRLKAVKAQYNTLKHALHKELQSAPSEETDDLYHSILSPKT
jgi:LuxR family maltose regulon positive regulatory protein